MKLQKTAIRTVATVLALTVTVSGFSGCGFWEKEAAPASMSVKYDASDAVEASLSRLSEDSSEKAQLLSGVEAMDKVIALTFDGFASTDAMARVLALLDRYRSDAAFFMTGMEAAEREDIVQEIAQKGHAIGCGTLYGLTHMEEKSPQELTADFSHARIILGDILGEAPDMLKCRSTTYTDDVLSAAAAAGFTYALQSNQYISYQSFKDYESVLGYVTRLTQGSIVTIKLSGVLDADEYGTKDAYMPGERQAGIEDDSTDIDVEERLLQTIEWVLKAAGEAGYQVVSPVSLKSVESFGLDAQARQAQYQQARQQNGGYLAGQIDMVYTTERAAALTFYGIENQETLDSVLAMLSWLGARGTFFVSEEDLNERADAVKKILDAGHEIGAAILPEKGLDYAAVCEQLYMVQSLIQYHFNADVRLAAQVHGTVSSEMREAVSAMGLRLVGYSTAVDTSGNRGGAQTLIETLFKNANYTIRRGQIIYFRLDNKQQENGVAAQTLQLLYTRVLQNTANINNGAVYALTGVSRLLSGPGVYRYPVPDTAILPGVHNAIYTGHMQGRTAYEQLQYIWRHYIGNPDVVTNTRLPGFAEKELSLLDTSGKINTKGENVIFLTFDDWGTDHSINRILDVLKKHNVKATFFILTGYVNANPNLLRAIGEQGHDIGTHTNGHLPLSVYDEPNNQYLTITNQAAQTLAQDTVLAYQTLQSIVGDMTNEKGKPVLTRLFRPPTLAVSKIGLQTVFDCGFTYSVSGDFSTSDYKINSADALFKMLTVGMEQPGLEELRTLSTGSIVVMHMTESAQYTPEALDRFLTWNEAQPAEKRFAFARLSDYL